MACFLSPCVSRSTKTAFASYQTERYHLYIDHMLRKKTCPGGCPVKIDTVLCDAFVFKYHYVYWSWISLTRKNHRRVDILIYQSLLACSGLCPNTHFGIKYKYASAKSNSKTNILLNFFFFIIVSNSNTNTLELFLFKYDSNTMFALYDFTTYWRTQHDPQERRRRMK